MAQQQEHEQAQIKLRLESDLKHRLKVRAAQNRRTLNGEIEYRLERSLKEEEERDAKPKP